MADDEDHCEDPKGTPNSAVSTEDVLSVRKELEESLKARVALLSKTEKLEKETQLLREAEECRRADVERATDDLKRRLSELEGERDQLAKEKMT